MNLWRAEEIYLVAQAIEAMVFKCDRTVIGNEHYIFCLFEGRESLRINLSKKCIYLTAMSGSPVLVYVFKWWRIPGDYLMWRAIKRSLKLFDEVVDQIKLHDYRAFFGNHIQQILSDLAMLMERAEAEQQQIMNKDQTHGGTDIHPKVQAILQVRPPELSMYDTTGTVPLESPHGEPEPEEDADSI